MAINALSSVLTSAVSGGTSTARPDTGAGAGARFTQALNRLVEGSEDAAADANVKVASMLDGTGDVHDAMIAMQRADLSLQLTVQVRNRLMNAYQEIMRMPV